MRYGYYDDQNREYVITRPDTPTPWMNYLGAGRYGGIISNTAGGFSFDRDPRARRVTRYRYNAVPVDQPGRYIYLRDQENDEYWSPTWQPVTSRTLTGYECRHGAGYTLIASAYRGIRAEVLYFIPEPLDERCPCEIWRLRLRNTGRRVRRIRSYSYAEYCYWDALTDLNNLDWGQQILETREESGVLLTSTRFRPTTTFFASSRRAAGFDSDRDLFVGAYRDLSNPLVVESGRPRNSRASRGNNIASLCHHLTLAPGQEKELIYVLGVTDCPEAIAETVAHFARTRNTQAAFNALRADWDRYLASLTVKTPDREMNVMLNVWNPIQCRTTLYWSRFVSAYETGLGRGMGTRDSAQDVLATVQSAPARARETLDMLWRLQFRDGHTWHLVFPLTGEGGPGLAAEFPDWPQWFSDDHLWLILATAAYLRETGDFDYLDHREKYQDGGEETVWGHLLRAIEFTLAHRGPHGLPRLGFSDWDDTLNLDHGSGKAESVWCGQQFCRALLDLAELSAHLGKHEHAARWRFLKDEMAAAINRCAWNGAWYARAFDDAGLPLGVAGEAEQEISLNPQTWAILGQVADPERARLALKSAHAWLNTRFGLALMSPPYTRGSERVRGTSTYPPGAKENGGIFCHANTWA
ncbi:MAG: GH36-type glycosyl hydrolase domain-containing protein, partial [Rudaea sp.]